MYHNAALPLARRSAEVAWRLPCSASNTHSIPTRLSTAERRPTTGLVSEQGTFFFSCEGKHYIALDTDSYTLKVITQDGLNVC